MLSQQRVTDLIAERHGIPFSRAALAEVERYNRKVSLLEALALCDVLAVPLDQMLGDDPLTVTVGQPVEVTVR